VLDPAHPLLARYEALVAAGAVERDEAQLAIVEKLERLALDLARRPVRERKAGLFSFLRRRPAEAPPAPRGVYIWGPVGRGKTTLMDLFFDGLAIERKRRVHFHSFMIEAHARLHRARKAANGGVDPVARVAGDLARETRVLCFDEFAVTDIADATILTRLFSALFAAGVVTVATSNVEPCRLYEGGRNRDLFLPFIGLLEARMDIARLEARTDFRLEKPGLGEVFFSPADDKARVALDALFRRLAGDVEAAPESFEIAGRRLSVPTAAGRVARFTFDEICGRPLGAADYLALARRFDAVIVENVPAMGFERRNEAKRFITLVDVLYEARVKLALSADAEPEALYRAEQGHEAQEFARAASRLVEMRSGRWPAPPHPSRP
jgi:cell division protein ZapE